MIDLVKKETRNAKDDILSGLTVALALVPEAVAFAFVANIPPIIGLYGAFMMGLITAIFGGRPGMISGATGALAVVMVSLVADAGDKFPDVENAGLVFLFSTLILMGLIQISAGLLKLGKFVRLIPHPVMMGFVNGLAIVIGAAQIGMFKNGDDFLTGANLFIMLGLVVTTMFIMWGLPKLTKKIPSGLAAIVVVSLIAIFGKVETSNVNSFIAQKEVYQKINGFEKDSTIQIIKSDVRADLGLSSTDSVETAQVYTYLAKTHKSTGIEGSLPSFSVPEFPFSLAALWFIFPYALILAAIGLIESLMTLQLIDEMTESKGNGNRECIAQGGANIANGFFGGMGGCAMIGQSIINVNSGGKGRLSGVSAAIFLLIFILFLSDYIGLVPIAALVGVMFMVVIGTFEWSTFKVIRKIPLSDALVILAVTVLTVLFDLAIAVIAGVIISALVFAWKNALRIRARKSTQEDGSKLYEIYGPLFFGSVTDFNEKFDIANDPDHIVIDFIDSKVSDHSGIEALDLLIKKYDELGKKIILKHLSKDCQNILIKNNKNFSKIIETGDEDPRYFVLEEKGII
ncbi:MAG: SulP family sulfate permease [Flavobacteriales bacterium]|jgi:SulP family sulfate permease